MQDARFGWSDAVAGRVARPGGRARFARVSVVAFAFASSLAIAGLVSAGQPPLVGSGGAGSQEVVAPDRAAPLATSPRDGAPVDGSGSALLSGGMAVHGDRQSLDRPLGRALGATSAGEARGSESDASDSGVTGAKGLGASRGAAAGGGIFGEVLPTALALGATLLAIVLVRSLARRLGGPLAGARRPSGVVEVLARYPVSRGQQVVLLKVARRVIVACQTPAGLRTLGEFTDADDVADVIGRCESGARGTAAFSFDAILRRSARVHDEAESGLPDPSAAVAPAPAGLLRRGRSGRAGLPDAFAGAEVETIDLTRGGKRGAR